MGTTVTLDNRGAITVENGATLNDQGIITVDNKASLDVSGSVIVIGAIQNISSSSTVTVESDGGIEVIGQLTSNGTVDDLGAVIVIAGAILLDTSTFTIDDGGSLSGSGTVQADVNNSGTVTPGSATATGVLTIKGNYLQTSDGALDIAIGGLSPGSQFDQLAVSGSATLSGTLNVSLSNGFIPAFGNRFQVLRFASYKCAFSTENGLKLSNGKAFTPVFAATNLTLQVGANVSADVSVTRSGFRYDFSLHEFVQTVTIKNTSGSTLFGSLALQLTNLSSNTSLDHASGADANGNPYIDFVSPSGQLAAGQSITVTLYFKNPAFKAITYDTQVWQGLS